MVYHLISLSAVISLLPKGFVHFLKTTSMLVITVLSNVIKRYQQDVVLRLESRFRYHHVIKGFAAGSGTSK